MAKDNWSYQGLTFKEHVALQLQWIELCRKAEPTIQEVLAAQNYDETEPKEEVR